MIFSLQDGLSKMKQLSNMFKVNSLISLSVFEPHLLKSVSSLDRIIETIWLKDFSDGQTLLMFNQLLKRRSNSVQYEVFVGTSDDIMQPSSSGFHEIINQEVYIPKYIWTYLKSLEVNVNEEFVVIGVNTPFVELGKWDEIVFCEDVCNTIEWLKPMEKIRQMPYMGYMFCCNVTDEVKNSLDGFPKSVNK